MDSHRSRTTPTSIRADERTKNPNDHEDKKHEIERKMNSPSKQNEHDEGDDEKSDGIYNETDVDKRLGGTRAEHGMEREKDVVYVFVSLGMREGSELACMGNVGGSPYVESPEAIECELCVCVRRWNAVLVRFNNNVGSRV